MMKKLLVMLFAAAIVFGFTMQETTHAENQIPRITSIQQGTFVTLAK